MAGINLMTLRRLIGSVAVYSVGDFVLFGLSYLILIPVLTRYLSPDEYGVVATMTALSVLLLWVLQLGLPSAALRYYFLHESRQDRQAYFSTMWLFGLAISAMMAAGILTIGEPFWNLLIRNAPFEVYAGYVVWGAFFQVVFVFTSTLLRAQERPLLFVSLAVARFGCLVVLVVYHVTVWHLGAVGQVRAAFLTYAIFGVICTLILLRNLRLQFRVQYIGESLRFAIPILVGYLVGFFVDRGNVLILQYLTVGSAVGVFALGQQLSNLIVMASGSFEKAWQPFFYGQSLGNARVMLVRLSSMAVPAFMSLVLMLGLFAPEIIRVLSSAAYADAWIVLMISGMGAAFSAMSSILNLGIYYAKRSGFSTRITIIGAVVNVALNLILIPHWGIVGASLASVSSSIAILFLTNYGMHKFLSAPLDYIRLLSATALGIASLVLGSLFLNGLGLPLIVIFAGKVGIVVFYLSLLWVLGIFPLKEDINLVREMLGPARLLQQ